MKKNRGLEPPHNRIRRFELSQGNMVLRVVLISIALCVGFLALGYGFTSLLNTDPGWQEVEVATADRTHGEELTVQYYFGASGISATAERKELSTVYTELMEHAYLVFSKDEASDSVRNLHFLNRHPNEDVQVDEMLYAALEKLEQYESRYLYLAPAYVEYDQMFLRENEEEASWYDPMQNEELLDYVGQVAAFASNPEHIDLTLLGDNTVRLFVSEEYLAFAAHWGIEDFLDFAWMRNAFLVDSIAEMMMERGYYLGHISSYDGFVRNLDNRGESYSFNLFQRVGNEIRLGGILEYTKPLSIVYLRNYPMTDMDRWHHYAFSDGTISTIYLDVADGKSKSAVNNLVSYSGSQGCADILLQTAPVFIADRLEESSLDQLAKEGIFSIWNIGDELRYNDVDGQFGRINEETQTAP